MIAYRRWAIAAGPACIAVLLLSACGGGDDTAKEMASGSVGQSTPAASKSTSKPDLAAIRERAYADLPEDQRPVIEEGENGAFRYSGKTENGEAFDAQLGGVVEIPKDFPKDIPIYPDSVPFSAMQTEGGISMVTLDNDDSESKVYEYYKEKLPASGWTVENEINVGNGRVLNATKGDLKAMLHVQKIGDGSRIAFMVGPKN